MRSLAPLGRPSSQLGPKPLRVCPSPRSSQASSRISRACIQAWRCTLARNGRSFARAPCRPPSSGWTPCRTWRARWAGPPLWVGPSSPSRRRATCRCMSSPARSLATSQAPSCASGRTQHNGRRSTRRTCSTAMAWCTPCASRAAKRCTTARSWRRPASTWSGKGGTSSASRRWPGRPGSLSSSWRRPQTTDSRSSLSTWRPRRTPASLSRRRASCGPCTKLASHSASNSTAAGAPAALVSTPTPAPWLRRCRRIPSSTVGPARRFSMGLSNESRPGFMWAAPQVAVSPTGWSCLSTRASTTTSSSRSATSLSWTGP
mmetsp:Transcript_29167/g.88262  ORF Transcript_29167/g.88262 Transcript_29167/m.88262 type:complete len:317 (+) Transcript_29167:370-1320(+)